MVFHTSLVSAASWTSTSTSQGTLLLDAAGLATPVVPEDDWGFIMPDVAECRQSTCLLAKMWVLLLPVAAIVLGARMQERTYVLAGTRPHCAVSDYDFVAFVTVCCVVCVGLGAL